MSYHDATPRGWYLQWGSPRRGKTVNNLSQPECGATNQLLLTPDFRSQWNQQAPFTQPVSNQYGGQLPASETLSERLRGIHLPVGLPNSTQSAAPKGTLDVTLSAQRRRQTPGGMSIA